MILWLPVRPFYFLTVSVQILLRIVLEEYVSEILYIKVEKYIVADALSILTLNENQKTSHKPTY